MVAPMALMVRGMRGTAAISTSHDAATEAGARLLAEGATAVDAALAAAAKLCVVYPNNVALGGDLVALVRDPSGRTRFVNATGRAAAGETLDRLAARHGGVMPDRGVDTITVPGGLRGWQALAELGGTRPWRDLLSPARDAAGDGHPVARSVAFAISGEATALAGFPEWNALFRPGGRGLAEGDPLVQPALAETFDRLIVGGPAAFYEGELARRWVEGLRARGSRLDLADLAGARADLGDPIAAAGFGHRILTSPPNTQGFSLLRTMRRVAAEGLADPLGDDAGRLATLFHEANAVRASALADPDVGATADELIALDPPGEAAASRPSPRGDTVGLVVVSDGWAVSLVQSVFETFGSGVLEPSSGVLFQNRGAAFSLDPTRVAAFAGGRRPPHSLMPVLVERDGELAAAVATMGGQAQPQIHAQLLLRMYAGASALEATHAPRFTVGRQDDDATDATVLVERDADPAAIASLRATPLEVRFVPPRWQYAGHSNLIRVVDGGFDASSDARSDGSARVLVARTH
jgi:gamma-glutamyltranspeptidase